MAKHKRKAADADGHREYVDGVTQLAEPRGLQGMMGPDEKDAYDADLLDRCNQPGDSDVEYHMTSATPKGRDDDADTSMLEDDDSDVPIAARVGSRTVEHPRSRMARAMHEAFSGSSAAAMSAEDLAAHAERFGMQVDGTGANGSVLKSDLVRAFDGLAREYPAPASP